MMTQDEIKHLGLLARLEIDKNKAQNLAKDFKKIVAYISSLDKVKMINLKTAQHPSDFFNVFRDDNGKCLSEETYLQILNQAPDKKGDYIKVKKII